ncbi:MAG: hypothetical protein ACRDAK_08360, partial [Aeromonas veronii]
MASLVVLERHLWLNLTEIKDQDKMAFLDAPVSPSGLFGPAVEGFTEHFTAAPKVASGHETLFAETLQLDVCFQLPLACAGAGPPQKLHRANSPPPRSSPGVGVLPAVAIGPTNVASSSTAVFTANHFLHFPQKSKFPLPLYRVCSLPLSEQSPDVIQPLTVQAEAWKAIPGVSSCVLRTVTQGYSLQFVTRPPRFSGVVQTSVHSDDAQVLRA